MLSYSPTMLLSTSPTPKFHKWEDHPRHDFFFQEGHIKEKCVSHNNGSRLVTVSELQSPCSRASMLRNTLPRELYYLIDKEKAWKRRRLAWIRHHRANICKKLLLKHSDWSNFEKKGRGGGGRGDTEKEKADAAKKGKLPAKKMPHYFLTNAELLGIPNSNQAFNRLAFRSVYAAQLATGEGNTGTKEVDLIANLNTKRDRERKLKGLGKKRHAGVPGHPAGHTPPASPSAKSPKS